MSHVQPEPNRFTPPSFSAVFSWATSPKVSSIAVGQAARRLAAAARLHQLPEERMVRVAAAVVAHGGALVLGDHVEQREHLLERAAVPLGAVERLVEVVDVGLVMLSVVDAHRLLVDRRFECVVVVRERGKLVGHRCLLRFGSPPGRICSAPHPKRCLHLEMQ